MKKVLTAFFLFLNIPAAFAAVVPPSPPTTYILDQAAVLSPETETALEEQLSTLEQETSTEIAILTTDSLQGYAIEEYAIEVARVWGVGQEGNDNGILLVIAPVEREIRIEVGYGLEGVVTDAQSSQIINKVMVPLLQTGDYDQGTIEGISYLDKLARGETFTVKENQDFNTDFFSVGLIYAIQIIWFFLSYMSNTKSWWMGGVAGAVIGFLIFQTIVGVLIIAVGGLLFDFLLSTKLFGMIKPPRGGSGGFMGGSGFGGSGGFGGFGGGGFGGGGGSGRF